MQRLEEFKKRNEKPIKKWKGLVGWSLAWGTTISITAIGFTTVTGMICKIIWKLL